MLLATSLSDTFEQPVAAENTSALLEISGTGSSTSDLSANIAGNGSANGVHPFKIAGLPYEVYIVILFVLLIGVILFKKSLHKKYGISKKSNKKS